MGLEDIQFFGAVDRHQRRTDGRITSEYPAWYFDAAMDELEETIARKQRSLDRGEVPLSEREYVVQSLKMEIERLKEIKNSIPKLKAKDKDALAKVHQELAGLIRDSMYTRSDMMKGLANAHEEVRRMLDPIIPASEGVSQMAQAIGIEIRDGKISRNQASRIYKIAGKLLGENTNTEVLRRDRKFGTYASDRSFEEIERGE